MKTNLKCVYCGGDFRGQSNGKYCSSKCRYRAYTYDLTPEEYQELVQLSGNCCAICLRTPRGDGITLMLDHNHVNNKVRGFLCIACNHGLGSFRDSVEDLCRAVIYIQTDGKI